MRVGSLHSDRSSVFRWTAVGRSIARVSVELWTIVGTQIATWVTLLVFLSNRLDAQSRDMRERFDGVNERIDAQGRELRRELGDRFDALTARFDAHLERLAS
ncbi:MAG: hypothetical protein ACRDUY_03595 [Nitriliruptorales bacterium]